MSDAPLPHECVYARLGPSDIHGIGVFAVRDIPRGTNVFASDQVPLVWVEREALERAGLSEAERSFYRDFGIARGSRIGCPVNFHNLTPGWYCNEPADGEPPNIEVDEALNFHARRDIAAGEELTVRYAEFSDQGA